HSRVVLSHHCAPNRTKRLLLIQVRLLVLDVNRHVSDGFRHSTGRLHHFHDVLKRAVKLIDQTFGHLAKLVPADLSGNKNKFASGRNDSVIVAARCGQPFGVDFLHHDVSPPSRTRAWPLIAAFWIRNSTAAATSSGVTSRFCGLRCLNPSRISSVDLPVFCEIFAIDSRSIGVSTKDGHTAFTVTPCSATSCASEHVRPITACLAAPYAAM